MEHRFKDLVDIMETLRSPGGCPWDREQSVDTLKKYLLEESYELLEELEEDNPEKIKEELGDLLFQIVFLSQIFKEKDEFDIYDVINKIATKMKTRHPHIFGEMSAGNSKEVLKIWEEQKKKEYRRENFSVLDGIPKLQPSLLRAHQISERVARVGFEWPDISNVIEKLEEEIKELKQALKDNERSHIEEEIGDILFTVTNIARHLDMDSEIVLKNSCTKFENRWRYVEDRLKEQNKKPRESTLAEMEEIWQKAKVEA
ncbi:MAG: nucleoside triphosphate pyrophosphohydrolase [Acidobacteria bacterium]|nr:nucleoside triphosphate pyrophosphohydrolase [Acidobacteriota bacterium]